MRTNNLPRSIAALAGLLLLAACGDSVSGPGAEGVRIAGIVTDDAASKGAAEVDDATVNAREVDEEGVTRPTDGETTTDENGEYLLETSAATDFVLVAAARPDFSSQVVVDTRVTGTVGAVTMTAETAAEADVFVESRRQGEHSVSMADVAAYVSSDVAARIRAGAETAARIALAIGNAERTRDRYIESKTAVSVQAAAQADAMAYREYQAAMTGHVSASASASARAILESRVASSHDPDGSDSDEQARANEAGRTALVTFSASLDSAARLALRKRAEVIAAIAATAAIEAEFEATSASRAEASAAAGAELRSRIEVASSESAIMDAWSDFRSEIHGLVAAEMGVSLAVVGTAVATLTTLEIALDLAIESSTTVDAIVEAKSDFYAGAESQLRSSLGGSAQAETGARILALVEAR